MSADGLFEDDKKGSRQDRYCHVGFKIWKYVVNFFSNPYKEQKRELNVLDSIQTLLESEPTAENINKCQELSKLHRMVENTRARRRLEKMVFKNHQMVPCDSLSCCCSVLLEDRRKVSSIHSGRYHDNNSFHNYGEYYRVRIDCPQRTLPC